MIGNHFQQMSVLELDEQEQYDVVTAVEAHLDLMRRCGFSGPELVWTSHMQAGLMGIRQTPSV